VRRRDNSLSATAASKPIEPPNNLDEHATVPQRLAERQTLKAKSEA
jgi:hypothetical protein